MTSNRIINVRSWRKLNLREISRQMDLDIQHKAVYCAFDIFPSAKGAATHINKMASTLFNDYNGGLLICLGNEDLPVYQKEGQIEIVRFKMASRNYLEKAFALKRFVSHILNKQHKIELTHYRDPWSGMAIEDLKLTSVYEINALLSIELPYHYPKVKKILYLRLKTLKKVALIAQILLFVHRR